MIKSLILFVFILPGLALASNKVVYGEDNRLDVFEETNCLYRELALSTAAQIPHSALQSDGNYVDIIGSTLASRGICSYEKFAQQMTAARCSGFLVGDDLLVTAGHCITSETDCANYSWVFDYKQEEGRTGIEVSKDSVYRCKKIIERSLDNSTMDDYALIRLDRKVVDRPVLDIRKEGKPQVGDEIVVIGHPTGLPTKISAGANIRALKGKYFTANLDTFGGNSGSAVFNATTGMVEGILVRGETDYTYDYANSCRKVYRVSDSGGRGEDVTYITNINYLK